MSKHARTRIGRILATAAIGGAVMAQSLVGAAPAHAAAPQSPKYFDRKAVITRAKTWTDVKVPYSQTDWLKNYRTDCSGFVSMAWGLDSSYVTWSLPEVSKRIEKNDLLPGDIILHTERHVIIFAGWADKARTRYYGLEQVGGQFHEATARTIRYPYDTPTAAQYKPYRYTGGHNLYAPGNTLPAAWVKTNAGNGSILSAGSFADATNKKIAAVKAQRDAVKAKVVAAAKAKAKAEALKKAQAKAAAAKVAAAKARAAKAAADKAAAAKAREAAAKRAQARAEAELAKQPVIIKMVRAVVALFIR